MREKKRYGQFYLWSLVLMLAASAYPVYMGGKVFFHYLADGMIPAAEYPKYIIPYAPMCVGLILVTAVYPLLDNKLGKYALPAASALGILVFLAGELCFEQIPVLLGETLEMVELESWQLSLCIATPEVLQTIGKPIYAENNPAFKVHFYLIAVVIILTVTGLLHGYTRMIRENDRTKKRPLLVQTVCTGLFIGFCILACFTAFFRNGTIRISPLSSVLTGIFFILFGVTVGTYGGTLLFAGEAKNGKAGKWNMAAPVMLAVFTTLVMYLGELVLMGGELFRFGRGFFFEGLGWIPFSLCDLLIIAGAGVITGLLVKWLNRG